ncbi:hypothetical protein [Actimicrobium antarcticum]|uniref:Uncharacterized protein n=1 Tax=Actimicrobium antarcticum TaxID=1051899 RepID=A0ABP7TE25_9BURK
MGALIPQRSINMALTHTFLSDSLLFGLQHFPSTLFFKALNFNDFFMTIEMNGKNSDSLGDRPEGNFKKLYTQNSPVYVF